VLSLHYNNYCWQNHTQTLAEFYGKEQHDEFQGHRTVAPPELDSTEIVTNELNTFKPQLFMYKLVNIKSLQLILLFSLILQDYRFSFLVQLLLSVELDLYS
jgi:hypothetical protein